MAQNYGYAGSILRIDLSTVKFQKIPTEIYSEFYLGGRGIATKLYWDEVGASIAPFDPENRLIFITGPICGIPGFAGSRWQVVGKSSQTDGFSYCNIGEIWGTQLKFAGYDGLVIHGKADRWVHLVINADHVELRDASTLKGRSTVQTREMLKNELGQSFRVVTIGPAGENMVSFATMLADSDSSGSGGLGAVMGSKNLKAISVRGQQKISIADEEKTRLLQKRIREIKVPPHLLPSSLPAERLKREICYGCIDGCVRTGYTDSAGKHGKFFCQSSLFYDTRAQRYYGEVTEVPFHAAKLCDEFGVDTRAIETMIMWLSRCYRSETLREGETGLPLSKIGSLEFIETLVRQISLREGFGDVLAQGTHKAADSVGENSERFITDYMITTGENSVYGPRLYVTPALLYAFEPRLPIQHLHEISVPGMVWAISQMGLGDSFMNSVVFRAIAHRFFGSETAADFSTIEGKALAAAKIQDREYAKESLILCDLCWPIMFSQTTKDNVGDPTLESQICSAVTGRGIDEKGLYQIGERVFNLQRAILLREGRTGRLSDILDEFEFTVPLKGDFGNPDCIVPGKDGQPFSRKGMVFDRQDFEAMKDEYYSIRGWDVVTGLQKREKLRDLGLDHVLPELEQRNLVV